MDPSSAAAAGSAASSSQQDDVNAKIMSDLVVVTQKMDLLDSMLSRPGRHGSDDQSLSLSAGDDALLTVVGFLEACAPRMIELVEAAAQGALSEQTLMQCLEVNDRLTKVLGDVDGASWIEDAAQTSSADDDHLAAAAAASPPFPAGEVPPAPMSDSLLSSSYSVGVGGSSGTAAAAAGGGGEESAGSIPTIQQSKSEDEFDSFFNERAASGGSS